VLHLKSRQLYIVSTNYHMYKNTVRDYYLLTVLLHIQALQYLQHIVQFLYIHWLDFGHYMSLMHTNTCFYHRIPMARSYKPAARDNYN